MEPPKRLAVLSLLGAAVLSILVFATPHLPSIHQKPKAPSDPTLTYTQDAVAVHLHIHNPNRHWGIHRQRLLITLHDSRTGFSIIKSYGPDANYDVPGDPHRRYHCCEITLLPPGGDYTFDLPLRRAVDAAGKAMGLTHIVKGIVITLRGGDGWVRM